MPLIVENPYSKTHYLVKYFPIQSAFVDADRTQDGDYYKKPTQYWFINCKPQANLVFEPIIDTEKMLVCGKCDNKPHGKNRTERRSMIHPQYARRFIIRYIGHSVVPL